MPVVAPSNTPVKKRLPLWAKVLIGAGVLLGLAGTAWVGFIVLTLIVIGNAGTQYNTVVKNEAARVQPGLLVEGCTAGQGGEFSIGNLDAIEKYQYEFTCSPKPAGLDQAVAGKLSALGYTPFSSTAGIFRNKCCEVEYTSTEAGYTIGLYSNQVEGRTPVDDTSQ